MLQWLTGITLETLNLFHFDNISAEDVILFLLKQMYQSLPFFVTL